MWTHRRCVFVLFLAVMGVSVGDWQLGPEGQPMGSDASHFVPAHEFMESYAPTKYKTYENIPNIVHRILLKDQNFPLAVTECLASFWNYTHVHEGDFVSILWTREDAHRLVETEYPQLLDMYDGFPKSIERADAIRYMILDQYGGIYADHDVMLKHDLKAVIQETYSLGSGEYDWIGSHELTLSPSFRNNTRSFPIRQKAVLRKDKREAAFRVANYFMWSAPQSEIGKKILAEMERRAKYDIDLTSDYDVLFVTGPDLVSTVADDVYNRVVFWRMCRHVAKHIRHYAAGHWLYRPPAPAPEPVQQMQSAAPASCFPTGSTPTVRWSKAEVQLMKILIGIPSHNHVGYLRTTLQALYESFLPHEERFHVLLIDGQTTAYHLDTVLHHYLPLSPTQYTVMHRDASAPTGADASQRFIAQYFISHPEYDVLLFLDSGLVVHQEWYAYLQALLLTAPKRAVLSLHHSGAASHRTVECQGVVCQKASIGTAGAVFTQEVARLTFPDPIPNQDHRSTFDRTWVESPQGERAPFCVLQASVVMHIATQGPWGGGMAAGKEQSLLQTAYSPEVRLQMSLHSPASNPPKNTAPRLTIPKHFVQTWPTSVLARTHALAADQLRKTHPNWKYTLYNDTEAVQFLRQRCGDRAAKAFQNLKPRAFRADLFRYCFLYVQGGVYVDMGARVLQPLDDVLWPSDSFVATLAIPPGLTSSRTFVHTSKNMRCGNRDGRRSITRQESAFACFQHCELVRGCGECEQFSWSVSSKLCMYGTGADSCDLEQWGDFDVYKGRGRCYWPHGDSRTFFDLQKSARCSNFDGKRNATTQPTAAACFQRCEATRGCGKCNRFSWSDSSKECMFSTASETSCILEQWDDTFAVYQGTGKCQSGASPNRVELWPGFVACAPGLPFMWHAMWMTIRRVEQRFYPELPNPKKSNKVWSAVLSLTGPGLLSDCVARSLRLPTLTAFPYIASAPPYHVRFLRFRLDSSQVELDNGVPVLWALTAGAATEETLLFPRPRYVDFVRRREVYVQSSEG